MLNVDTARIQAKGGNGGNGGDRDFQDMIVRVKITSASVPEPSSVVLLGLGIIGLGIARRRTT